MQRLILKLCDIGHSRETSCSLSLRSRLSGDLRYIKHQGRLAAFDLPSLLRDIYLLFLILAYIFLLKLVYREREQLSSLNLFLPQLHRSLDFSSDDLSQLRCSRLLVCIPGMFIFQPFCAMHKKVEK